VMVETADDRVEQATNAVQREHPTTVQVCTRKASSAPKHSGAAGSGAGMAA